MTSIIPTIVATGGAVTFNIVASGQSMSLSRAVSGIGGLGAFTEIYSGPPTPFYVDAGDGMSGPLDPNSIYVWQLTDANGPTQSVPVQPAAQLNLQIEPITALLLRLLQCAVNSLQLPKGVDKIQVLHAMPIAGLPQMPFVTLNLDLMDQAEIPIGQQVFQFDNTGTAVITGLVERNYKVSVLGKNALERDFYRDMLPPIFEIILAQVLMPAGMNVEHRYMIASGQVAKDLIGKGPGFYYADALLSFKGSLNCTVTLPTGLIAEITFTGTADDGVQTEAIVPIPPPF
jgi:hypothetical protein